MDEGINITVEVSLVVLLMQHPFSNTWNKNLSIVERKNPLSLLEMWYISKCGMPQFDNLIGYLYSTLSYNYVGNNNSF